jgi:hypothetical protein
MKNALLGQGALQDFDHIGEEHMVAVYMRHIQNSLHGNHQEVQFVD